MNTALITGGSAVILAATLGCSRSSSPKIDYDPEIDPANFVETVDNTFLPLAPGTTFIFEGESDGETELNKVVVGHETVEILGVTCIVVYDSVWVDGELVEATEDWFAQDVDGNVWYFGEDSREIEDGQVVSTEGSWTAGVDGAKPGIVMQGDPQVGQKYRQEYYVGEAEDEAEVVALDAAVTIDYGMFAGCLQTLEWSRLEPGISEDKYYAVGVGLILIESSSGGDAHIELTSVTSE